MLSTVYEEYGMNDYIFEKYGGMMGLESWYEDGSSDI